MFSVLEEAFVDKKIFLKLLNKLKALVGRNWSNLIENCTKWFFIETIFKYHLYLSAFWKKKFPGFYSQWCAGCEWNLR